MGNDLGALQVNRINYDDDDDDDDDDDEREDKEEEDYLIRCKMGPQACIMVWPDGYQGVSSYDYA